MEITCRILQELKLILESFKPDVVLVHGDTTTTVATSLAALDQRIPVGQLRRVCVPAIWILLAGRGATVRSPVTWRCTILREPRLTSDLAARKYQRQPNFRHRQMVIQARLGA
ncbi:UDP-N-acetylglucosamine 2-epimerase [Shigella flexneri]